MIILRLINVESRGTVEHRVTVMLHRPSTRRDCGESEQLCAGANSIVLGD